MKKHQKEDQMTRRSFLRQSACASLGVVGMVNALAHLRLISAAMAQTGGSDYKALVCIFLNGGNDSNNLLVPMGNPLSNELRADYETGRGVLALPVAGLHALNLPGSTKAFNQYHSGTISPIGVHPGAQGLADLFNSGDLAFLANVGTLAYPIPTRNDYISGSVPVPPQLFSHSDQQLQWQSSIPDKPFTSGWGGRAADLLHASYNSSSNVSMSISIAGINSFQVGTSGEVIQYALSPTGTIPLSGFGTDYVNAVEAASTFNNPIYKNTDTGKRLQAFENIVRLSHENLLEEEYNKIIIRSRQTEGVVGAAITAAQATGVNFDTIFTNAGATASLGQQLKMVAKMIAGRSPLGNNRQIFFCQVGGYDTHQAMLASHANLMIELSTSLKAFKETLSHPSINAWDKVVAFSASDFNRTLTPNGTDSSTAGSDHAWAGHCVVAGGPVNGGDIYGHFPPLKTGNKAGSIDSHTERGRWIPSISVDQYSAKLASWLGADASSVDAIFPNLARFDSPFTSSTPNLGFL